MMKFCYSLVSVEPVDLDNLDLRLSLYLISWEVILILSVSVFHCAYDRESTWDTYSSNNSLENRFHSIRQGTPLALSLENLLETISGSRLNSILCFLFR